MWLDTFVKGRKKDGSQLPNSVIIKWDHSSTGSDTFEKGREGNGNKSKVLTITRRRHYRNRFTAAQDWTHLWRAVAVLFVSYVAPDYLWCQCVLYIKLGELVGRSVPVVASTSADVAPFETFCVFLMRSNICHVAYAVLHYDLTCCQIESEMWMLSVWTWNASKNWKLKRGAW